MKKSTYKINRLKHIFVLITLIIPSVLLYNIKSLNADIFFAEGETKSTVTAYLTTRFSSYKPTKGLQYKLFIPQSIPEGLTTQSIYGIRKTFTPRPTNIKEVKDKYGNVYYECTWNKDIRIVQIDLQFKAKIHSQFTQIDSNAPFPLESDDNLNIYLSETDLIPVNEYSINYISRTLAYNLHREIDVVYNIALWVNENIRLKYNKKEEEKDDALTVLNNKEGNEKGICNLLVSMYRGIGIPSRVAYGISFQKELKYSVGKNNIYLQSPNNERYWVEVYFPDAGWLPIDIKGLYLSLPSYIIKLASGPDTDYLAKKWSIKSGKLKELKEYIYDLKVNSYKLNYTGKRIETKTGLITSCSVPNLTITDNKPDLNIIRKAEKNDKEQKELKSKRVKISENLNPIYGLNIVATGKKIYVQRFEIKTKSRITEIKIPVIKFSDNGKIWIEVLSDNGGKPGKRIFRTFSISSTRVRYMMIENPWLSFPISKKAKSILEPGYYWFALRSSGSCIFNWFATEGDVIGSWNDTLFLNTAYKKPKWNNILNLDLDFQIFGIPIKQ